MPRPYVPVRQDSRKMRYIGWLTTPPQNRVPATEREIAAELDVYPKTLYNWRNDREFRDVWRDDADEVIGGEDKRQRVMETLYMAAIDYRSPRHVAAAKLYLETIGAIGPQRIDVQVTNKAVGLLTEEELDRLIQRGLEESGGEIVTDGVE
jgi:Helix-turn-helix of insertion element transposase